MHIFGATVSFLQYKSIVALLPDAKRQKNIMCFLFIFFVKNDENTFSSSHCSLLLFFPPVSFSLFLPLFLLVVFRFRGCLPCLGFRFAALPSRPRFALLFSLFCFNWFSSALPLCDCPRQQLFALQRWRSCRNLLKGWSTSHFPSSKVCMSCHRFFGPLLFCIFHCASSM